MSKGKSGQLNIDTVSRDIDDIFYNAVVDLGYNPQNASDRKAISQNELTAALHQVYYKLFQPDKTLINNQASIIDYNNNDLLKVIVDKFLQICFTYNKSMGLLQFSLFTGISTSTLYEWREGKGKELNPERSAIIKTLCEVHKGLQIGLLNGAPVGALAVANNDHETGLEWSKNQAQQITNNTVYVLPSERSQRLQLDKLHE